jgi:hypothetical protein
MLKIIIKRQQNTYEINLQLKSPCYEFEKQLLTIAVFFFLPLLTYSQAHQLKGLTQDSLQNPVPNTNIIATPVTQEDFNIALPFPVLKASTNLNSKTTLLTKLPLPFWAI